MLQHVAECNGHGRNSFKQFKQFKMSTLWCFIELMQRTEMNLFISLVEMYVLEKQKFLPAVGRKFNFDYFLTLYIFNILKSGMT